MAEGRSGGNRVSFLGPRIVAGFLVVGAIFLVYHALQIGRVAGYTVVGPSTIPLVVSVGLLGLGVLLALRTTLRPDDDLGRQVAAEERATHWPSVGLLVAVLVVYALALNGFRLGPLDVPGLGYVVATSLFLPLAARVLGSEHPLRDLVVGIGLAITVYVGFTQFLGVRLPAGLLGLLG
jgi:putative tricarboxylic transport membrane protein